MGNRLVIATALSATMALLAGAAVAQDTSPPAGASPGASPGAQGSPGTMPAGETITVVGLDYHFEGLPTSVPAGTSLQLRNDGQELHELVIVRKNEGTTETWDELLVMPEDEVFTKVTFVGQVFATPGETTSDVITLDQEGEYLALCFVPQGMTEIPDMPMPGESPTIEGSPTTDASPAAPAASPAAGASPGGQEGPFGPPHYELGMIQEFVVTAPGTTPGPLPSPAVMGSPEVGASPPPDLASPAASPSA